MTEIDPSRIDIAFWREHWRRTRLQGIIVNAGGIVAYYPSQFPQHRASLLNGRDLLSEIFAAGREEGLSLVARLDSNRVLEPFHELHPDWCCVDAEGKPYRVREYYLTCVHSPYYSEYMPSVIREIIGRVRPDGFADNSWSGLGRGQVCHCPHCKEGFSKAEGKALPKKKDWQDPVWLSWLGWNTRRRLEIWDLNNQTCAEAGGEDCLWAGMAGGGIFGQSNGFRDLLGLAKRSRIVFLDHQGREEHAGFQGNADAGKAWHELVGWDTVMIESMAMYQIAPPAFRLSARPEPEAHLWMLEGIAAGIQPWWHHVGAVHEDKRQYETAVPVFEWHSQNEELLVKRRPIAPVAVLWSQENLDFYGRDEAGELNQEPHLGWTQALQRHRIPYRILHIDHLERESSGLSAVILPNLAGLSDAQCASLKAFAAKGGAILASGESSRFDEKGRPRPDFALAELFGAHAPAEPRVMPIRLSKDWDAFANHSYLRLHPELNAATAYDGMERRHPVLAGFEKTDLIGLGGTLSELRLDAPTEFPLTLTWVRPFPIFPPESSFPREHDSRIPALILRESPSHGRVAFLAADIDRCFYRTRNPDLGLLLANLVRWACQDRMPVEIQGPGLLDIHLYSQGPRRILHIVNLSNPAAWQSPADQWLETGPYTARLRRDPATPLSTARTLVTGERWDLKSGGDWHEVAIPKIKAHEVLVFE